MHRAPPGYQVTRTTIPTRLESLFILPRNIGYHIEHHWYPSVPFYRLPELHERLLQVPSYLLSANIHRSVWHSLVECTKRPSRVDETGPFPLDASGASNGR